MEYAFLALAVLLTSVSQVLQKLGAQRAGFASGATVTPRQALARVETRLGVLSLAVAMVFGSRSSRASTLERPTLA